MTNRTVMVSFVLVGLLGACGDSGSGSGGGSGGASGESGAGGQDGQESNQEESENALAFSECMRENGVETFPDPEPSPIEVESGDDSIVTPFDPEAMADVEADPDFRGADEACRDIMLPDGAGSVTGEGAE